MTIDRDAATDMRQAAAAPPGYTAAVSFLWLAFLATSACSEDAAMPPPWYRVLSYDPASSETPQSGHDVTIAQTLLNRSPAVVVRAVAADNASMKKSAARTTAATIISTATATTPTTTPHSSWTACSAPRRRLRWRRSRLPSPSSPLLLLRRLLRRRLRLLGPGRRLRERNGGRASRLLPRRRLRRRRTARDGVQADQALQDPRAAAVEQPVGGGAERDAPRPV